GLVGAAGTGDSARAVRAAKAWRGRNARFAAGASPSRARAGRARPRGPAHRLRCEYPRPPRPRPDRPGFARGGAGVPRHAAFSRPSTIPLPRAGRRMAAAAIAPDLRNCVLIFVVAELVRIWICPAGALNSRAQLGRVRILTNSATGLWQTRRQ